ncbi:MAG: hypothetical protein N3F07_01425 [Candidatus Micrarchaeota archaeon]|nr:hypothetical protein [Candidatus Micrarchaeota archaeon]
MAQKCLAMQSRLENELDISIYGIIFALIMIVVLSFINALIYVPAIATWIYDETGSSESAVFWSTQAVPFRIHYASKTPQASPCGGSSNGYVLEMENVWIGTYSITGMQIDGQQPSSICDAFTGRVGPVLAPNGKRQLVGIEMPEPVGCVPGEKEKASVQISYRKEDPFVPMGVPREGTQASARKLMVACNMTAEDGSFGLHFESGHFLPPIVPGKEYFFQFKASGGVPPYTYSTKDYLYGLKFDSDGRIYGMPLPSQDLPPKIKLVVRVEDAEGRSAERVFAAEVPASQQD